MGYKETYKEALQNVKSAIKFHIETGWVVFEDEEVMETFISRSGGIMKFPRDALRRKVIKTFETLGFKVVKVGNHISIIEENPNGTKTPLTMPNHERIKGSTLRVFAGK